MKKKRYKTIKSPIDTDIKEIWFSKKKAMLIFEKTKRKKLK